jgi:hypothetical protein
MELLQSGIVASGAGAKLEHTIEGVMGVQTAVVVVSRAGGYKRVYYPADLSVEGGVETIPERNDPPSGLFVVVVVVVVVCRFGSLLKASHVVTIYIV